MKDGWWWLICQWNGWLTGIIRHESRIVDVDKWQADYQCMIWLKVGLLTFVIVTPTCIKLLVNDRWMVDSEYMVMNGWPMASDVWVWINGEWLCTSSLPPIKNDWSNINGSSSWLKSNVSLFSGRILVVECVWSIANCLNIRTLLLANISWLLMVECGGQPKTMTSITGITSRRTD